MRTTRRSLGLCALAALLLAPPLAARADHPYEADLVGAAHRLERNAQQLRAQLDAFLEEHPRYWLSTVHRRDEALRAMFAVSRLLGSVQTFHALVDQGRLRSTYYSLPPAYELLLEDVHAVGRILEDAAHQRGWRRRGRWAPDPFNRFVASRMLESYENLADEVERMGYIRQIERLPYVPPTPPLEIAELNCYKRRKYTYRMNVCIEGRSLDRSRLRVELVKRMNRALDPWQREVTDDELTSLSALGDGRERRCYFLRQIGKDIRRHEADNVYVVLERPDGAQRTVAACWEDDALEDY